MLVITLKKVYPIKTPYRPYRRVWKWGFIPITQEVPDNELERDTDIFWWNASCGGNGVSSNDPLDAVEALLSRLDIECHYTISKKK